MDAAQPKSKNPNYREDGLPTKKGLKMMVKLGLQEVGKDGSKFFDKKGDLYYADEAFNSHLVDDDE